jgi:hypothetical protein
MNILLGGLMHNYGYYIIFFACVQPRSGDYLMGNLDKEGASVLKYAGKILH